MAHTIDTSLYATGANQPQTMSYTCGAGSTLFVLGVVCNATVRAGGVPTFGGIPMTIINVDTYDSGETISQLYYLLNPSTGSAYTVSVPNTGTARTLYLRGSSYKAQSGYTTVYDASARAGSTGSANPSTNISVTAGGVAVQIAGDGLLTLPTAYTHPTILPVDHGALTSWMTYALPVGTATIRMGATVASDDWSLVTGSWKEEQLPPAKTWGGILKYYNGSAWAECPNTMFKFYRNSTWTPCTSTNFKIYTQNAWYPIRMTSTSSTLLNDLIAYWKFEEASGAVYDSTANDNDLTSANSPTYQATGKIGYGINFAAATSILYRSATNVNPSGNAFTISCHFNLNTLPSVSGDDAYICRFGLSADPYYAIDVKIDTGDDLIFAMKNVGDTPTMAYVNIASTGVYYHLVCRMKGIGYSPEIWINGSSVGTVPYDDMTTNLLVANANFNIGNAYTGDISHFDGIIDEFGVWDRAITDAEIAELYNSGNGRTHPF